MAFPGASSLKILNELNLYLFLRPCCVKLHALLTDGVTGNTSDFGSEESRFEP